MIFLTVLAALSTIGSLAPLLKSDYWLIRGQDYFKHIYLILNTSLLVFFIMRGAFDVMGTICILGLVASVIYCARAILPFTPIYNKQVLSSPVEKSNLRLYIFNVYQYNENHKQVLQGLKNSGADIIFLSEINSEWRDGLDDLFDLYPYSSSKLKENTYGLLVLSKYQIESSEIHYLVRKDVPSLELMINFNGERIKLWMIHPKPPVPGELEYAGPKDAEVEAVAEKINKAVFEGPVILAGDLNDVAWSPATLKFVKKTALFDPRRGRGFYPTFPSWSPLKIPIDQVLLSKHFRVSKMSCSDAMGSDHHPFIIDLEFVGRQ